MDNWLSYWNKNSLFLSTNEFSQNKQEIKEIAYDSINDYYFIYLYSYGLWGIKGLIFDLNVQEQLKEIYEEKFLNNASNIILNALINYKLQWVTSYNNLYYFDYNRSYSYIKYWDYQYKLFIKNNDNHWQLKKTSLYLKIGDSIDSGVIGNYYWSHEKLKKPNKKILLNYKIR
jgi:hypothetical protein